MDKRNWRVTIGIDYYFLTEEEKNFYLRAVQAGQEFAVLKNGLVLTKNFQTIISMEIVNDFEKIEKGWLQCPTGRWHPSEIDKCYCDKKIEIHDGKAIIE